MKLIMVVILFVIVFEISRILFLKSDQKNKYDFISVTILLLFFAFNISLGDQIYRVVGENLKFYINTATILVFVLLMMVLNKNTFKINWVYWFFVPLTLNLAYSGFLTNKIFSEPMFLRVVLNYASIYLVFLVANSVRNINIDDFLGYFNFLAIGNGILGICQMITKKTLLIGDWNGTILYTEGVVDGYRAVGIAGSNNSGGNLAALLFVITLANFVRKKDFISALACVLTVVFGFLTGTRIALVSMGIALLLFFFFSRAKTKRNFNGKISLFFMGMVGLFGGALLFGKDIFIKLFTDRGDTAGQRFVQYNQAWNVAMKTHFWNGIGSGQWRAFLYNGFGLVDIPIHSEYLNFWVENGFIIFILNIIFNFGILWTILTKKRLSRSTKIMVWVFFITNLIVSNFNPNQIYTLNLVIYYLVMFIIMLSLQDKTEDSPRQLSI